MKKSRVLFPKVKNVGKRDWGKEELLVLISKVLTLKRLLIKKGKKGGLQYHHKKNECGYLIKGKLIISYDRGDGKLKKKILSAGSCFHFPPGSIHQEEAMTDCEIIEASTPHFNDRVRVEKFYNLPISGGLPSSSKKQVKFL